MLPESMSLVSQDRVVVTLRLPSRMAKARLLRVATPLLSKVAMLLLLSRVDKLRKEGPPLRRRREDRDRQLQEEPPPQSKVVRARQLVLKGPMPMLRLSRVPKAKRPRLVLLLLRKELKARLPRGPILLTTEVTTKAEALRVDSI